MKTQMMQFRVTDEEKDLIEKCAKKARMTVSEYIRACMLMEMVVDGEMQALKNHRSNHWHEGDGCVEPSAESQTCARLTGRAAQSGVSRTGSVPRLVNGGVYRRGASTRPEPFP